MFSTSRVISVGSAPDATLHLDDPEVAPRHAIIYVDAGRVYIASNGPANKIVVNGNAVGNAEVSGFDDVRVGNCRLKIEMVGAASAPSPSPPHAALAPAPPPAAPAAAQARPSQAPPPERGHGRSTPPPEVGPPGAQAKVPTTVVRKSAAPPPPPPTTDPTINLPHPESKRRGPSGGDWNEPTAPTPSGRDPKGPILADDLVSAGMPVVTRGGSEDRTETAEPRDISSKRPSASPGPKNAQPTALARKVDRDMDFGEESRVRRDPAERDDPRRDSRDARDRDRDSRDARDRDRDSRDRDSRDGRDSRDRDRDRDSRDARDRDRDPRDRDRERDSRDGRDSRDRDRDARDARDRDSRDRDRDRDRDSRDGRDSRDRDRDRDSRDPGPRDSRDPGPRDRTEPKRAPKRPSREPPPPARSGVGLDDAFGDMAARAESQQGILPPALHDDHDEDDEEREEREFVPSFSLLENVVRERFRTPIRTEGRYVAEVIRYKEGRLLDVQRVDTGGNYTVFDSDRSKTVDLIKIRKTGKARLFFKETTQGNIAIGGKTTPLANLLDDQHLVDKKQQVYAADLSEGDYAHIKIANEGYLLRFVKPPLPPEVPFDMSLAREDKTYISGAFVGMIVMLAGIWLQSMIAPPELLAMEEPVEFAEVSLKELDLEEPEKPKPPEPEPEPEPTPPADEVAPPPSEPVREPPKKQPKQKKVDRRPGPARPGPPGPADVAQQQATQALAALASIAPTNDKSLSVAVSNIAAVRVPTGATKNFRVSGAIGKLPTNDVVLSTGGGGGGRETRAAASLLAGRSNVGAIAGGGGGGKVRGVVDRAPARAVNTSGGSLSRAAILEVVNAGIGDVQRCYERQLLKSPGIQGKLVMDWVIDLSGAVESTRVRSSTLKSQEVATCVGQVIKSWRFPKPVGGTVKVTFPFVFSIQGF